MVYIKSRHEAQDDMNWKSVLENEEQIRGVHTTPARFTAGYAIGIIAVHLIYPKLPGNVANATTYPFPVLYREVDFEIERLFSGDPSIEGMITDAAKDLERSGVRAIIGACGYFAHFQDAVREAVSVPVFMSSLCQLPMIKQAVDTKKKIAVLAASGDNLNDDLLKHVGTDMKRLQVISIGELESFSAIRWGRETLDNGALISELEDTAYRIADDKEIGAILLECSDLPPYARMIQGITGLPVFDFNTMIDMVYHSVVQKTYLGYF